MNDDLALVSTTHHGMSKYTNELVATAQQFGLHINDHKTKVLKTGDVSSTKISVDNKDLEFVEQFKHLGAKVDAVGGATIDIQNPINRASTAFFRLWKIWRSKSIRNHLKFKILTSHCLCSCTGVRLRG